MTIRHCRMYADIITLLIPIKMSKDFYDSLISKLCRKLDIEITSIPTLRSKVDELLQ